MAYQPRVYRQSAASSDLVGFGVARDETDLYVQAEASLVEEALAAIGEAREQLARHLGRWPEFATSLKPLPEPAGCASVVSSMYRAAQRAGTGPMAAVAGAIAAFVGERLLAHSHQVIVENGGDIFLATQTPRTVAIQAGTSPLSGRVGLAIPADVKLGVCTSSGTVGPSYSAGQADAAVIVAADTALADALASALGNRVQKAQDCQAAVVWASQQEGVLGAVAICGDHMAAWGDFALVAVAGQD